jgi:SAM-dependent methyltransferase
MKKVLLGCGEKKREGWINVDIDERVNPDYLGSATSLPFEDESIDCIDSQHMFEHLFLKEVEAALYEWSRVLKKGGELFIELPNLDQCCRLILNNSPDSTQYKLGIVGLYGYEPDIHPEGESFNIFMMHKHGWSPRSIKLKLEQYGFSQLQVVPILQTHRVATKHNRDFRIQATKK